MSSHVVFESFGKTHHSDYMVGMKRNVEDSEDDSDVSPKRVKIKDLLSVLQSNGNATYDHETSLVEDSEEQLDVVETQSSQIVDKDAVERATAGLLEGASKTTFHKSKSLDLDNDLCTDENSSYNNSAISVGDSKKQAFYEKYKHVNDFYRNSLQVTSSGNHNFLKTRDTLGKKDALSKWKEMKENGFMSVMSPLQPRPAPKQRGRKKKTEALNQKMQQAKTEQVDRLVKIAAPSGLLNGLNPGIINHVRNSKQVHSIIHALVRSEKQENLYHCCVVKEKIQNLPEKSLGLDNGFCSEGHESLSSLPKSEQLCENRSLDCSLSLFSSGDKGGLGFSSHSSNYSENDEHDLRLASSNMVSENTSCLSNDVSATADTLSVKAAKVASQWLQLLHQDIKGRLAALRQSKMRVTAVITTELPFLLSKEFGSNQENDPSITKDPSSSCFMRELHQAQWHNFFNQMHSSLSEEEKQQECWLNEVNKMLKFCDQGLRHVKWNMAFEMQRLGAFNHLRSNIIDAKKELTVRAAAASIYSTGSYVSSKENLSCW